MPDTYTVNGVDLRSLAWRIETAAGLQDQPEQRGGDVVIPQMHGSLDPGADLAAPRRRYEPGSITFNMWLKGVDPVTGAPPSSSDDMSAYFARLSTLERLFAARTFTIEHPRADGARRCTARLSKAIKPAREVSSPWFGRFVAECTIPGAFWRSTATVTASAVLATGGVLSLAPFASSTAPIADSVITFGPGSNPLLVFGGGYFRWNGVIAAGRQLQVDTSTWQVGPGAGTVWAPAVTSVEYNPGPSWFEFDPASGGGSPAAVLTHTGGGTMSVSITARNAFLAS